MTKNTKDEKSLLTKISERDVEVERDSSPEVQRDIFDIDTLLTQLDEVPNQKYLDIPESVKKRFAEKGVKLAWIRVKGEGGEDNYVRKESEGWRLLPASAVPEMAGSGVGVQKLGFMKQLNRDDETANTGFIVRKDVALAANYETNVQKVKGRSQEQASMMEHSLKSKAKGQGLEIDKESSLKVKTGENALFG